MNTVKTDTGFDQEPSDGRECADCGKVIEGDMFRLNVEIFGKKIITETFVYCLTCAFKDEN